MYEYTTGRTPMHDAHDRTATDPQGRGTAGDFREAKAACEALAGMELTWRLIGDSVTPERGEAELDGVTYTIVRTA
ncbi:hypothetical protein [Deinococcus maricopensis]|uniref:Molybdopterin oxidoreductase n=1 Tax=Deinococcus maricopensis (strain DSM 21211 / LMG 22137 / NRRL B-23946 / LB-34) TaxID=709986 RepID=E8U923_DEIML|nr:hypothetical protein [Deinococcus maricopensis]ADV67562.1 molybdopterin oxidoreductase [Deinococcus maricopensis DSM 21211]